MTKYEVVPIEGQKKALSTFLKPVKVKGGWKKSLSFHFNSVHNQVTNIQKNTDNILIEVLVLNDVIRRCPDELDLTTSYDLSLSDKGDLLFEESIAPMRKAIISEFVKNTDNVLDDSNFKEIIKGLRAFDPLKCVYLTLTKKTLSFSQNVFGSKIEMEWDNLYSQDNAKTTMVQGFSSEYLIHVFKMLSHFDYVKVDTINNPNKIEEEFLPWLFEGFSHANRMSYQAIVAPRIAV